MHQHSLLWTVATDEIGGLPSAPPPESMTYHIRVTIHPHELNLSVYMRFATQFVR